MNLAELNKIAQAMVAPGKGILAADESSGTIKKRFDAIGVESTEDTRRDYREMLFRSAEGMKHISGVILYDETIRQQTATGQPFGGTARGTTRAGVSRQFDRCFSDLSFAEARVLSHLGDDVPVVIARVVVHGGVGTERVAIENWVDDVDG